ncbi:autoinducer binding domain-containing protein [uncultured Methylobacterium sp.]|uniref:autoinducer binding domain-containing protein n=1 Tax=uncultured Methylobacterium sp. TaxID=157278 RepID=UPI0035CB1DC3
MIVKSIDRTYGLFQAFDRAASVQELNRCLLGAVGKLGVESTFAGVIPVPGTSRRDQAAHVLLDSTPAGWSERYFKAGHLFRDPTIRRLTTDLTPFQWSDIEPQYREDAAARRVMEEAGDFRLRQGFTVPLITLDGRVAGFSFGAERFDLSPELRGMLQLVASYAFGRSIVLSEGPARPGVHLTPREHEALQWAADGKTEWEIGELMSISEHGAEKHLRAVRAKLGTASRAHAVAEAFRRGLLR